MCVNKTAETIFMADIPRITKENYSEMNKYKQNLYTILLILTCFVASPFIIHRIWKTSSDAKKQVSVPPQSVSSSVNSGSSADSSTGAEPSPEGTVGDASQTPPAEQAPETADIFGPSSLTYFDDALFIGDSRTVGIQEYGTFKNSRFFCSVGMSSSNIDNENINGTNFEDLIKNNKFGKVYVMLGVNEVGNDFEFTLTKYRAIIERLRANQPDAIIYIQGNLHVSAAAETNVINNANINYLNSLFAGLADNKKVFYIDINELYDDEYGYLNAAYTADGVHPLAAYYQQWCEWLCQKTVITNAAPEPATADPNYYQVEPTAAAAPEQ